MDLILDLLQSLSLVFVFTVILCFRKISRACLPYPTFKIQHVRRNLFCTRSIYIKFINNNCRCDVASLAFSATVNSGVRCFLQLQPCMSSSLSEQQSPSFLWVWSSVWRLGVGDLVVFHNPRFHRPCSLIDVFISKTLHCFPPGLCLCFLASITYHFHSLAVSWQKYCKGDLCVCVLSNY